MDSNGEAAHKPWRKPSHYGWALILLSLIPLHDLSERNRDSAYQIALETFRHGSLEISQHKAERGYLEFRKSDPVLASKFQLLEAEAMSWRGMSNDALDVLAALPRVDTPDTKVERLTLESVALAHLRKFPQAAQGLAEAEKLCAGAEYHSCAYVSGAHGVLAIAVGNFAAARGFFLDSLRLARTRNDKWLEATSLLDLGTAALQDEHYDEAIDWSHAATQVATGLEAEDVLLSTLGNLGWAYYKLGDPDKALDMYKDARQRAIVIGDLDGAIWLLMNAGRIYQDANKLAAASQSYRTALELAKGIKSAEQTVTALEELSHVSVQMGKFDDADRYIGQLAPLLRESNSHLDMLDIMLAEGEISAARREDAKAEQLFRAVEHDPASQTSMQFGAEHQLARLYEAEGRTVDANSMYATTLATFESARADLKNEASKLPFLTNATRSYDDYIHFLVDQGKSDEALQVADQSRARTLAQGLGVSGTPTLKLAAIDPAAIAKKTGATLLFYWLGERESYLWAITPAKTALLRLPSEGQITPVIERYRRTLLGPGDAFDSADPDGLTLYKMLVAPARALIHPGSTVIILCDGILSQLNFETLIEPAGQIAPGPQIVPVVQMVPAVQQTPVAHYFIEEATVISAPSLSMLAMAKPARGTGHSLLLLGDAISPDAYYPRLPEAAVEMREIQKHFRPEEETVFARQQANSAAYLASQPQQFAYIHFVAHGVASRSDPLDSAIILSRTAAAEDSFKLHARDIIQHPIDARLVTISACYGSGTRSYAGEGLVGLSWAFLRAGAHNVIGALWEVSDDSTPRLMDALYQGLEDGMPPSEALRRAKLGLLHSRGNFRKPFYWAPFQIYTGL